MLHEIMLSVEHCACAKVTNSSARHSAPMGLLQKQSTMKEKAPTGRSVNAQDKYNISMSTVWLKIAVICPQHARQGER